jgi:hypothetical protein
MARIFGSRFANNLVYLGLQPREVDTRILGFKRGKSATKRDVM